MPPDRRTTLRKTGIWEQTIKRSRFIGICRAVRTENDASGLLEDARKNYPDARHYCYAWRTNDGVRLQRYSDDGEPSGTGGLPLLNALDSEQIDCGVVVVVRYFGGILLGASGLARAYGSTALEAVRAAEPVAYRQCPTFLLEADYAAYERLRHHLERLGYVQRDPVFGEAVRWQIAAPDRDGDLLRRRVMDLSSGNAAMSPSGEIWLEDKA